MFWAFHSDRVLFGALMKLWNILARNNSADCSDCVCAGMSSRAALAVSVPRVLVLAKAVPGGEEGGP